MRVPSDSKSPADAPPRAPGSFQRTLHAVAPPRVRPGLHCHLVLPAAAGRGARGLRAARPGSAEGLRLVRSGLHAEAQRLGDVRSEGLGRSEQRDGQRMAELISRELRRELTRETAPSPLPEPTRHAERAQSPAELGAEGDTEGLAVGGAGARKAHAQDAPEARAEAALALIERIELFVRSQRPAMALSVGGALAATVEVERTGPREVALRLTGRNGPPAPTALTELRAALEARGLRLRSLEAC
ncbi:hypothetical protein FGE12_02260 [Aggregicoccus sp. 17bor-14]|uniref:hypothetical protein n=1 Tax=Myxococcaceae TaxID=31 RepID=UPI00129CCA79|nr:MULTISPECIES: hypothetical protein [Myxococcaceae]MBF5041194.1 hypothetical protein [Simulacricoccus sp. 17bor-14]MRI86981.1 hypothetical protein [Aggregicoccus sp. 17bor-14]